MNRLARYGLAVSIVFASCAAGPVSVYGAEARLHEKIDAMIEASAAGATLAPPADDSEFVRRVYLDLAGRIPSVSEARQFFADKSPDKRRVLVDRLLDGPEYPRRMHELFHAMLMERRGENEEWARFLRAAFRENTPWDQLARAIIRPDAENEAARGAAYFFTSRLVSEGAMAAVDVPGVTRDVGRLFAGVDLACAQCHDHVSIGDYKQVDFQGLHVIFENVKTRRDVKFPAVSEGVMTGEKEFMSVFVQNPETTPPRVPGGKPISIATFPKGEEYKTPPDRKSRSPGVPKFSPLEELAKGLASGENPLFARNIANRLWFVMMGRGLVEPLDLHHGDNPATHPELLELLASEFSDHKFNVKWLLRELALTNCYQRTSVTSGEPTSWKTYAVGNEKRLSAEQLFWSTLIATGELDRLRDASSVKVAGDAAEGKAAEADKVAEADEAADRGKETVGGLNSSDVEEIVAKSKHLVELQKLFQKTYANPPKEPEIDFEPTVKGALFLMNDERLLALLQPNAGNLMDRAIRCDDANDVADELFLSLVSRLPTKAERTDVRELLGGKQGDLRVEAIKQVAWALLASTEFCVNH